MREMERLEAARGAAAVAATSTASTLEALRELLGAEALRSFQLLQEMHGDAAATRAT